MRSNFTKYAIVGCISILWVAFVGAVLGGFLA